MDQIETPYVEDEQIFSPPLQNGVNNLGDLWKCRNSKAIGHNLFKANSIPSEHLRITPIKNCDYTLTHVKNELETAKSLNVQGHLTLDLLLNVIKLHGNMKFQYDKNDKTHSEVISCRYINENYRIDLIFPVESLINQQILQLIASKQLEATHVVGGMIIGSSVTALIEISEKESKKDWEISGELGLKTGNSEHENETNEKSKGAEHENETNEKSKGAEHENETNEKSKGAEHENETNEKSKGGWLNKLIGNFSGKVKAEWEEKEKSEQFDIKINWKARPMPSNLPPPNSVKQLFELIDRMPAAISEEKRFDIGTGNMGIHGVPIQFILHPIAQITNIKIPKLYKILEDDLMNRFEIMISKAIEIQQSDYVKKLIIMQDKELKFLLDKKSVLSDKVKTLQETLKQIGARFVTRSREQLSIYKNGRCGPEEFENIFHDFYDSEVSLIENKIEELADEGTLEIFEAQVTAESCIEIFADDRDKQIWTKKKSNPKIIFEVGPHYQKATVSGFQKLVASLINIEFKMALAMPSISKEVKLSLMFDDREVVFKDFEVQQATGTLCANFRIGNRTKADFFAIIAAVKGIEFPIRNNPLGLGIALQTLIEQIKDYSHFEFVDTINDFQRLINELHSSCFAFCLPINAPETALDFFQTWKDYKIKDVKWIVHSFGFDDMGEGPLLFVLSRTDVLAVCLDRLDLLILEKKIKEAEKISNVSFDLFSTDQLTSSFYNLRASSAFRFFSLTAPNAVKAADRNLEDTKTNSEVTEFLSFVRCCLTSNELVILSAVAQVAIDDFPALNSVLTKYGWNDFTKEFSEEILKQESCNTAITEMKNWIVDDSLEHEARKVENVLLDSTSLSNETYLKIYESVINHPHCPVGFKVQLIECGKTGPFEDVSRIFKKLKNLNTLKKSHLSFLHVRILLKALEFVLSSEKQSVDELKKLLISEYYEKMKWAFPGGAVETYVKNNQIYMILQQASFYKYDKWMCTLFKGLKDLHHLEDVDTLTQLIQDLSEVCTDVTFIEQIWANEQWLLLTRNCLSAREVTDTSLLRAIQRWIKNVKSVVIVPDDIQQKLYSVKTMELENFSSVTDVEVFLKKIIHEGVDTPWYFCDQLTKALQENPSLESALFR